MLQPILIMALSFYVVRHGETDANAADIIQGSCDISRLTPKGQSQASAIGSMLGVMPHLKPISQIYVSPLTRARDTLRLLRQSAPPTAIVTPPEQDIVLSSLREIDFYSWEYRTKDNLQRKHPIEYAAWKQGDPDGLVVDGKRPLRETWDRAQSVWKEIRSSRSSSANQDTAILLVCHGTLGQALLGSAFGLDATIFRRNPFPNCGMAEIVWPEDEAFATSWKWQYPTPTEFGCLRDQLTKEVVLDGLDTSG